MGNRSVVRLPLWAILNVPFTVILLISSGLVAYFGFQNGTSTASDLTRQLVDGSSERVQQNLASFFETARQLNDQLVTAIRMKQLDLTDLSTLKRQFLIQLKTHKTIQAI